MRVKAGSFSISVSSLKVHSISLGKGKQKGSAAGYKNGNVLLLKGK